jgi:UDP-hydrolysing UDP-N-acetyl-D-glucosamine 2-epimerase
MERPKAMNRRRKFCVVTGTRAEYGLLYWLLKTVQADDDTALQLVVTGAHLSPEFGLTYREIEADGFGIDYKVEMLLSSDTPAGVTKSMGIALIGFAEALSQLQPDLMILLGDRFEILAAAQAAMAAQIPIAHVHGGEVTEGAIDEGFRHAITKLSQWHFVAAEEYRKRVVQLGEAPQRVFNYGALGLEHIQRTDWLDRSALEKELKMKLGRPLFVVTYHPETLSSKDPTEPFSRLLTALDAFPSASVVLTFPNADAGGRALIGEIEKWLAANADRAKAFTSLGQRRYLSLLRECDLILGNSSSGLTEAPALKTATVNIGKRQKGRLRAISVIDAADDRESICAAITKALSPQFRATLPTTKSLYGSGDVSSRIVAKLKRVPLQAAKEFFDLRHEY